MIFKVCFHNEIHRCAKVPDSFESLTAIVHQIFKDLLPEDYMLTYIDQEGDQVILNAEDDFKVMMESCGKTQSLKVFVVSDGQTKNSEDLMSSRIFKSNIPDEPQQMRDKKDDGRHVEEKTSKGHDLGLIQRNENTKEDSHQKCISAEDSISTAPVVDKNNDRNVKVEEDLVEDRLEERKGNDMIEVVENEDLDLTDKDSLKAFILQTFEEEMSRIMSDYLLSQSVREQSKKKEKSILKGIKDVASQITTRVEKFVSGQKEGLWVKIAPSGKTLPEVITTSDDQIYVPITVKNAGTDPLPENSFLQSTSGLTGEMIGVPSLGAKETFKTTLILKAPKKSGNFVSRWRIGCLNQEGMTKYYGEELELKFVVNNRVYPEMVQKKALRMKELLPNADLGVLMDFVSQEPRKKVEILVDEYLLNYPSK